MKKQKRKLALRKPRLPTPRSTKALCLRLVGIAAFHVEDKRAQEAIYQAVRTLQQYANGQFAETTKGET